MLRKSKKQTEKRGMAKRRIAVILVIALCASLVYGAAASAFALEEPVPVQGVQEAEQPVGAQEGGEGADQGTPPADQPGEQTGEQTGEQAGEQTGEQAGEPSEQPADGEEGEEAQGEKALVFPYDPQPASAEEVLALCEAYAAAYEAAAEAGDFSSLPELPKWEEAIDAAWVPEFFAQLELTDEETEAVYYQLVYEAPIKAQATGDNLTTSAQLKAALLDPLVTNITLAADINILDAGAWVWNGATVVGAKNISSAGGTFSLTLPATVSMTAPLTVSNLNIAGTTAVYANGFALDTAANWGAIKIYGGSWTNFTGDTSITVSGGSILSGYIYGGNNGGTMTGNTNVTITAGAVGTYGAGEMHVFGGSNGGTMTGNTNVTVTGGDFYADIWGGSDNGVLNGTANTLFAGGTINKQSSGMPTNGNGGGNLYGGGKNGSINGGVNLSMTGGKTIGVTDGSGYIMGTGLRCTTTGDVHISVTGGTLGQRLDATGAWCTTNGNVYVLIGGNAILERGSDTSCSCGYYATINGNYEVTLTGGFSVNNRRFYGRRYYGGAVTGVSKLTYTNYGTAAAPQNPHVYRNFDRIVIGSGAYLQSNGEKLENDHNDNSGRVTDFIMESGQFFVRGDYQIPARLVGGDGLLLMANGKTVTFIDTDDAKTAITDINSHVGGSEAFIKVNAGTIGNAMFKEDGVAPISPVRVGNQPAADTVVIYVPYTVTFNKNGGDTEASPQTVQVLYREGETGVTAAKMPAWSKKNGVDAYKWTTGTAATSPTFDIAYVVTRDMTVYGQYKTLTVTYNGNGNSSGAAPVDSGLYAAGDEVTVLGKGTLAKTGYRFTGWRLDNATTGTLYQPTAKFSISANATLYAQWALEFTVTYNGNGNTAGAVPVDANKYIAGQEVTVLGPNTLEKDGFFFAGWRLNDPVNGTAYLEDGTFAMGNANATLYAMWSELAPPKEFTKTVKDEDGNFVASRGITDLSEPLEYQVKLVFPDDVAGYDTVEIKDLLPETLALVGTVDDVEVAIDGTPLAVGTKSLLDSGKTISYLFPDGYDFTTLAGKTFTMTFTTRIMGLDELGLDEYPAKITNTAKLVLNGSSVEPPPTQEVDVYGEISGFVFDDANKDGIYTGGTDSLARAGLAVTLTRGSDSWQTTTDANGAYKFADLLPGAGYVVEFPARAGIGITAKNTTDPNGNRANQNRKTDAITIDLGDHRIENHVNGGYRLLDDPQELTKLVKDTNGDYVEARDITDLTEELEYRITIVFPADMTGYNSVEVRDTLPDELELVGDVQDVVVSLGGVELPDTAGTKSLAPSAKTIIRYYFAEDFDYSSLSNATFTMDVVAKVASPWPSATPYPATITNTAEWIRNNDDPEEIDPPPVLTVKGQISGFLFIDKDDLKDGWYEPGVDERLGAGLTVKLTQGANSWQTTTDADGAYKFTGLDMGAGYVVEFPSQDPLGVTRKFTTSLNGSHANPDRKADPVTLSLMPSSRNAIVNCGYRGAADIEDLAKKVWDGSGYVDTLTLPDANGTLKYGIEFTLPDDMTGYTSLKVLDILPASLKLTGTPANSVTMTVDGAPVTGTAAQSGGTVSFSFDDSYFETQASLDALAGKPALMEVEVEFTNPGYTGKVENTGRVEVNGVPGEDTEITVIVIDPPKSLEKLVWNGTEWVKGLTIVDKDMDIKYRISLAMPDSMDGYVGLEVQDIMPAELRLKGSVQDVVVKVGATALTAADGTLGQTGNIISFVFDPAYDFASLAGKVVTMELTTNLVPADTYPDVITNTAKVIVNPGGTNSPPPTETRGPDLSVAYVVTFDGNGAQVEANPRTKIVAPPAQNVGTLPAPPQREGFLFSGWNTQKDGGGTTFTASTTVRSDITVYAQWSSIYYNLTFDVNGGSSATPAAQSLRLGEKAVQPADPTRAGHVFGGWNRARHGSDTNWDFANHTMPARHVTLYAQWTPAGGETTTPPTTPPPTLGPPTPTPTPTGTPTVTPTPVPTPTATRIVLGATETASPSVQPSRQIVLDVGDDTVPAGATGPFGAASWALLNLIMAILGGIIAIVIFVVAVTRRKKEDEEEERQNSASARRNDAEEDDKNKKRVRPGFVVAAVIAAVAGIILFILTEDMRLPMVLVDRWTIWNIVIAIITVVCAAFSLRKPKDDDEENPETGGVQYGGQR